MKMPVCPECGQSFATDSELQQHDQRVHSGMMVGRGDRVGERMVGGEIREEKKIGKLEEKEAKYKEKEAEHEARGQERMAERDTKKEGKIEEKIEKEKAKEIRKEY